MKKKVDPRHRRRQKAVQALFAYSFGQSQPSTPLSQKVVAKLKKIDQLISKAAPKWPLEKINRIDLAILRLAVFELLFAEEIPPKVAIDEAVELAKEFGGENSPAFVNGVLGTIWEEVKDKKPPITNNQ